MKTIKLNVINIHTVRALHIYIAYMLELPGYYGKNLDALHDLLGEICDQTCIVLEGDAGSEEMAAYLPGLEAVLADCAEENSCLTYVRA